MGRIKSAWEIALEKTADLQVDTKKLEHNKNVKKGSGIAGSYLNNIDFTIEDFSKSFDESEDKKSVVEGIAKIILLNSKLPQDDLFEERINKLKEISLKVQPESENLVAIFDQMIEFFRQYQTHQDQLINQMKEQFAPSLQQKEAQLRQQYGPDFKLNPEDDQEFMKLVNDNLKKLDAQYEGALKDVKENIKTELLKNY
jgi:hypothetical protein